MKKQKINNNKQELNGNNNKYDHCNINIIWNVNSLIFNVQISISSNN